jgi:hypothetical protein
MDSAVNLDDPDGLAQAVAVLGTAGGANSVMLAGENPLGRTTSSPESLMAS